MKPLAALLLLLTLTLDQAVDTCEHAVKRVDPRFGIYVEDTWELSFVANKKTLALFRKCMRDHGQAIPDGWILRGEVVS